MERRFTRIQRRYPAKTQRRELRRSSKKSSVEYLAKNRTSTLAKTELRRWRRQSSASDEGRTSPLTKTELRLYSLLWRSKLRLNFNMDEGRTSSGILSSYASKWCVRKTSYIRHEVQSSSLLGLCVLTRHFVTIHLGANAGHELW